MEFNVIFITCIVSIGIIFWYILDNIRNKKEAEKRRIAEENHKKKELEERLFNEFIDENIQNRSKAIQEAYDINTQYHFITLKPRYDYFLDLNTLQKFKTFDKEKYLVNILKDNNFFDDIVDAVNKNNKIWKSYIEKYNNINLLDTHEFENFILRYNNKDIVIDYNTYHLKEYDILRKLKYSKPVTDINIAITYQYKSPGGRNLYKDIAYINHVDFMKVYDKARTKKSFVYEQRKLMTNSIRYDVLKRDNFKCVLCGRGASDGVTLEVDHIIPVSKGGLTELNNLRTLCYNCNRGKSDKIE